MRKLPSLMGEGFGIDLANSRGMAMRGDYYICRNPTIGTGIAMGIQTSYSATANVLALVYNNGAKSMVLDALKLINTAAGASTTSSHLVIRLDNKDRYSSGGTSCAANTVALDQSDKGVMDVASSRVYFGAVTANAEGASVKTAARNALKIAAAPCYAVSDTLVLVFGGFLAYGSLAGTTAAVIPVYVGPVIIPPQWSATFHMWNVANATTPPSWEFELAWGEM